MGGNYAFIWENVNLLLLCLHIFAFKIEIKLFADYVLNIEIVVSR